MFAKIEELPWINDLFASIDKKDSKAFVSFLTEDSSFRYAGGERVQGRERIEEYVGQFFSQMKHLEHHLQGCWKASGENTIFVQGDVTYTLPNDRIVTLPFLNLFVMTGDKIKDYFVYTDPTPMVSA